MKTIRGWAVVDRDTEDIYIHALCEFTIEKTYKEALSISVPSRQKVVEVEIREVPKRRKGKRAR